MAEETPSKKYEVFLSFRGEDTRNKFISHLYKALCDRNIETFKDDSDLERGGEISPSLLKAIQESRISLIVFSQGYASSQWCLDELVQILQCQDQIVIPVFYEVDPTDVRNQNKSYAEAFANFEKEKKHLDKLQTWKDALKEATNHAGFASAVNEVEADFVKKIVEDVLKKLGRKCSCDNKSLIGIDMRIDEIEAILRSEGVRSIGIWGAGGIGKTTLAQAVFSKIFNQFEGSCFLPNVRERFGNPGGLSELQRELYQDISGPNFIPHGGSASRKRMLQGKRLLIVFDDVTGSEQIENLISMEGFDCLDSQSRVILTSRDSQVLNNCGVDEVYKMEVLSQKDAIKLFLLHTLRGNQPMWAYEELSRKFVERLGCLPLALKVIGSSLHKKDKKFWEISLRKLEKVVDKKIDDVLKISYDGLEDDQKKIFLDIVYFLEGEYKDQICQYLNYYEFVEVEIEVLIDKSLLVKLDDNRIIIHDLLQDMGRMIERKQPFRTRLSGPEDICNFREKNGQVIYKIQGISLDMSGVKEIDLNLSTFSDIKILEFYCSNDFYENKIKVSISEGCDFVWNALRKFYWCDCPLESFSSKFHPEHLVSLIMCDSKIEKLWDGGLHFPHLKEIDLSFSKHLTTVPDLSGAPNLKEINLSYCESLTCIPDCFACLTSLERLNMCSCSSLRRLPELSGMKSLKYLNLSFCPLIERLLKMSGMESLQHLDLSNCSRLEMLPEMSGVESLQHLDLSYCSRLEMFSELPSNIKELYLCNTAIALLPALDNLNKLEVLSLHGCSKIQKLPAHIVTLEFEIKGVPSSFGNLNYVEAVSFIGWKLQDSRNSLKDALSGSFSTLTHLYLSDCGITAIPDSLGRLSNLAILYLDKNDFESIPTSIINLADLDLLEVSNCKNLKCLPKLQSPRLINAANCSLLKSVHKLSVPSSSSRNWNVGSFFCLDNCVNLCPDQFKDVVEDFLRTLQSLAASWTEDMLSNNAHVRGSAGMSFPGSNMPEWFSFQCMGSSITMILPKKGKDKIFVGFAVCAVVDASARYVSENVPLLQCEYTLNSKDGRWHIFRGTFGFYSPHFLCENFESDHLFIGYDHSMYPNTGELCYDAEVTFEFLFGYEHKVKSCGVHPMYVENFSSGSLDLREMEDEPHPKRLKIQYNP